MESKEATLRDVAKLAEVSVGTVSHYLNGHAIGEKNKERIEQAIKTLRYSPNPLARNLAKGHSYSILLYIITESPIVSSTWMHELPIIQGISETIKPSDYSLIMEIGAVEDAADYVKTVDRYTSNRSIDALLLLTSWELSTELFSLLEEKDFPYVLVGSISEACYGKSVSFDNHKPVYEMTRRQYVLGHRRIALIGGFEHQTHMRSRTAGYREAMDALGLEIPEDYVRYGDYSLASGFQLGHEMLQLPHPPTSILCGNDNIASGVMKAAVSLGKRVPEDVCISGFDSNIVAEATAPPLTTVEVPAFRIGTIAGKQLLHRLENPGQIMKDVVIDCTVHYRPSSEYKLNTED